MRLDVPLAKRRAAGAIVSTDPLITIGKHEDGLPMGLASLFVEGVVVAASGYALSLARRTVPSSAVRPRPASA